MIPVVSVAAVLGKPDTRGAPGNRGQNSNRFQLLRDRSRSLSTSGRLPPPSPASKRRAEEEANQAGKQAKTDRNAVFVSMGTVEQKLADGKKTIDKLKGSLESDESCNSFLKEFLGGVIDTLDSLAASVESLASVVVDGAGNSPVMGTVPNTTQRSKVGHATGDNQVLMPPPPLRRQR